MFLYDKQSVKKNEACDICYASLYNRRLLNWNLFATIAWVGDDT